MLQKDIIVRNSWGLHVRVAVQLVRVAAQFECSIFLTSENKKANVKSIMGLLVMGVAQNMSVSIECDGKDENEAMSAIDEVLTNYDTA
ncbi:MAG: HPr family phosphocarrier protein [Gammaproteobacteria bacterium]|nr:HPr family phosphocarrier protein [Pseudomonadota bacterium]MCH9662230.1 HPr family phosphocarrier protein [Gammaproteobacteria bacterium]